MMDEVERNTVEVAAAIQRMMAGEGWHHLERLIRIHLKEAERKALMAYSVARNGGGLSREDYYEMVAEQKGAILAFRLILQTPSAIIESADDILTQVPPEQKHVLEEGLE